MTKRLLVLLMCLTLCLSVGCGKNKEALSVDAGDEPTESEVVEIKPVYAVNPLTGLQNLDPQKASDRPVAITVNNLSKAQTVQTGLCDADVVYETEVEGGITRLVAVYQDVAKTEKIGTVRSARYAFIDLAMGHNAIYVHHGQDSYHAGPHLKDVDRYIVDSKNVGTRISNGLSSEHTLYAYGERLWNAIEAAGIKTENTASKSWLNFSAEDQPVSYENVCNSVSVPFSTSYKTTFNYDEATGKYIRYFNGTKRTDYVSGEALYFKNIFVLNTTIRTYPNCTDGYKHREVQLNSGDGYYFVNGTYTKIKWSKGASSNSFKFYNTDGTLLTVNPGNSWVCLADKNTSQPIF